MTTILKISSTAVFIAAVLWYIKRKRTLKALVQAVNVIHRGCETADEIETVSRRVQSALLRFRTKSSFGYLVGRDNVKIHYAITRPDKGSLNSVVLLLPGWSEGILKYSEAIDDLNNEGHTVVSFDHRSQGLSGRGTRLLTGELDRVKSHIEDFHDLLADAVQVYSKVVLPLNPAKFHILGFSMGGLVSAHLATLVPCDGLILISPCLCPLTGGVPAALLESVFALARLLGKGEEKVPGRQVKADHKVLMPPNSRVSSSTARVKFWEQLRGEHSEMCINTMSIAHASEVLRARSNSDLARRVLSPRVLLMSAELDLFVSNEAITKFAQDLPARITCRYVHFRESKHELLQERNEIRQRAFEEVRVFLQDIA